MRNINDIIQKPSQALRAMVDGLLKAEKTRGLEIDMTTFGNGTGNVCYGCAATYCLMELSGKKPTPRILNLTDEKKISFFNLDLTSTINFESCIDSARSGNLWYLFIFFVVKINGVKMITNDTI